MPFWKDTNFRKYAKENFVEYEEIIKKVREEKLTCQDLFKYLIMKYSSVFGNEFEIYGTINHGFKGNSRMDYDIYKVCKNLTMIYMEEIYSPSKSLNLLADYFGGYSTYRFKQYDFHMRYAFSIIDGIGCLSEESDKILESKVKTYFTEISYENYIPDNIPLMPIVFFTMVEDLENENIKKLRNMLLDNGNNLSINIIIDYIMHNINILKEENILDKVKILFQTSSSVTEIVSDFLFKKEKKLLTEEKKLIIGKEIIYIEDKQTVELFLEMVTIDQILEKENYEETIKEFKGLDSAELSASITYLTNKCPQVLKGIVD